LKKPSVWVKTSSYISRDSSVCTGLFNDKSDSWKNLFLF
jgi:hypothetical protein